MCEFYSQLASLANLACLIWREIERLPLQVGGNWQVLSPTEHRKEKDAAVLTLASLQMRPE
jgi:hypothetical protein